MIVSLTTAIVDLLHRPDKMAKKVDFFPVRFHRQNERSDL